MVIMAVTYVCTIRENVYKIYDTRKAIFNRYHLIIGGYGRSHVVSDTCP